MIHDDAIKLVFGTKEGYLEQFNYIHNRCINDDFMDVKDKDIKIFIKEIEKKYNRNLSEIKDSNILLKKIIKQARQETNVSIRELADIFDKSKTTISRYLNEK